MDGKQVYIGRLNAVTGTIIISSFSPGIYTVQISNGIETLSRKFIKK
jgi:hypothetical protein